jgi:2'-5' RNA ligase
MRCFIAVDIDDKIRNELGNLQKQLQAQGLFRKADVKWVEPEMTHLTLKFLGEVKDEKIIDVCQAVQEVAARRESFSFNVKTVGCFGRPARVVWVGIEKNESLSGLQEDIEEAIAIAGWPPETRQFSPHLTLCRVKNSGAGRKLAELIKDYSNLELGSVWVDSVRVYRSDLSPAGPEYSVLSESKLR